MQKKTILYMAAGALAAGAVVYYLAKRKKSDGQQARSHKKDKHLTQVFSKAKGYSSGEYTL